MVLCCAIPMVAIWGLSFLGILGGWGYYALLLLCPLGHIVIMGGMVRGMVHGSAKTERKRIEQDADQN